jgi:serine/threonine-protein kinase
MKRAAQVMHAGLAVVLGVGQTEDGRVYVATEQLVGERLSDLLRAGKRWDEWDAAAIALQIAQALAAAHDAEVVHRELRPSLIVVAVGGDRTVVKVEGLGAPQAGADADELAYAAPEQRRGETAGRRADVYSIGGMLHAMLTGNAPGADASIPEGAVGAVVRRCLADDPKDRFLDTNALGAALKVILETRPASRTATLRPPAESSRVPTATLRPPAGFQPPPASLPPRAPLPLPEARRSARPPSVRQAEVETVPVSVRPPAAPPPRALGRPLAAAPRWKDLLLDLRSGPLLRVATAGIVVFVVARVLASTTAALVAALVAVVASYMTWGRPRAR